jgi:hypothetical protein
MQVLADGLDVPCRLLKGRQYTGSDDGALNIVKFKDGRYCTLYMSTINGIFVGWTNIA